jgi:hypothetical protein
MNATERCYICEAYTQSLSLYVADNSAMPLHTLNYPISVPLWHGYKWSGSSSQLTLLAHPDNITGNPQTKTTNAKFSTRRFRGILMDRAINRLHW